MSSSSVAEPQHTEYSFSLETDYSVADREPSEFYLEHVKQGKELHEGIPDSEVYPDDSISRVGSYSTKDDSQPVKLGRRLSFDETRERPNVAQFLAGNLDLDSSFDRDLIKHRFDQWIDNLSTPEGIEFLSFPDVVVPEDTGVSNSHQHSDNRLKDTKFPSNSEVKLAEDTRVSVGEHHSDSTPKGTAFLSNTEAKESEGTAVFGGQYHSDNNLEDTKFPSNSEVKLAEDTRVSVGEHHSDSTPEGTAFLSNTEVKEPEGTAVSSGQDKSESTPEDNELLSNSEVEVPEDIEVPGGQHNSESTPEDIDLRSKPEVEVPENTGVSVGQCNSKDSGETFHTTATVFVEAGPRFPVRPEPKFSLHRRGFNINGRFPIEDPRYKSYDEMDEEATQPSTQPKFDPRRHGLNNSGLSDHDLTDILCILHPNSIAAHAVVAEAARSTPQHVLQNEGLSGNLDETEDVVINDKGAYQSRDLALRMSSKLQDFAMGFTFGRNKARCDVVIGATEELMKFSNQRFSNLHLRIFITTDGILMLEDTSTNGTVVDGVLLRGKAGGVNTRMLNHSSIIQLVTSNSEEEIKFIVRFPARDGCNGKYEAQLKDYIAFINQARRRLAAVAEAKAKGQVLDLPGGEVNPFNGPLFQEALPRQPSGRFLTAGTSPNSHGMAWDGGVKYNVIRKVGKGSFAHVFLLADKVNGSSIAAKELEKRTFMKNGILDLKIANEINIMKNIKHPNIVQYLDFLDYKEYIYIMMEYVPCGDLSRFTESEGRMPEYLAKRMSFQMLRALSYLHKQRITHRDIKPENILVSSENPFHVKLSDFGLSKVVEDTQTMKTFCGTLLYCAPEVFPGYDSYIEQSSKRRRSGDHSSLRYHPYNSSVDLWSYAACLFHVLCTKPPFVGDASGAGVGMLRNIMTQPLDLENLRQCGISAEGIDFVAGMLHVMPAFRRSERKCLQHEWLREIREDDSGMDMDEDLASIAEEQGLEKGLENPELGFRDALDREIDDSEDEEVSEVDEPSYSEQRESKRMRMDGAFALREQVDFSSSPEISYPTLPHLGPNDMGAITTPQPVANRLFGEIGASALRSSGALGQNAQFALAIPQAVTTEDSRGPPYDPAQELRNCSLSSSLQTEQDMQAAAQDLHQPYGVNQAHDERGAPSLLGTEFLVGQLKVATSPPTTTSPRRVESVTTETKTHLDDPSMPYSRRLRDVEYPDNAETSIKHSKVDRYSHTTLTSDQLMHSGSRKFDHAAHLNDDDHSVQVQSAEALTTTRANMIASDQTFDESVPSQNNSPNKENVVAAPSFFTPDETKQYGTTLPGDGNGQIEVRNTQLLAMTCPDEERTTKPTQDDEFLRPKGRLGHIVSIPGSIYEVNIDINSERTVWGREPYSEGSAHEIIFPHPADTRVPKLAFAIYFHCPGMDAAIAEGKNWKNLRNVQPVIWTKASKYIRVNGVKLHSRAPDGYPCGKLYTGDIITIWQGSEEFLKLKCQFHFGLSMDPRPVGETFVVEVSEKGFQANNPMEQAYDTSASQSNL